jgi:hypothetical protein
MRTLARLTLTVAADALWLVGDCWLEAGNFCAGWARGLR